MKPIKTPYFVIDQPALDAGLSGLKSALEAAWPNARIGYSYKTNTLPWVLRHMRDQGCLAEVVSDDEYRLAKAMGAEALIYNGVAKSKETFLEALRDHQIVNIDSEYELDWLAELGPGNWEAGIRVNFDLESICPGQTQCGEDGERFGFCLENGELKRALDRMRAAGVRVAGLHLHKSSKTRMPEIYFAIAEAAVAVADRYDLRLSYVDIGGGFFGGLANKPRFPEYFDRVAAILRRRFRPEETALIVEPGMALIGAAADYVLSVLDVKKTTRAVVIGTDGSRTHIDPLMTKSSYFYEILRKPEEGKGAAPRPVLPRQIVAGFTCMEHDRLFELKDAEQLQPGDRIVCHRVGAYTMCLSPLFIRWFPAVYVRSGDRLEQVRGPVNTEEYLEVRG